jgi:hypothetical protein
MKISTRIRVKMSRNIERKRVITRRKMREKKSRYRQVGTGGGK